MSSRIIQRRLKQKSRQLLTTPTADGLMGALHRTALFDMGLLIHSAAAILQRDRRQRALPCWMPKANPGTTFRGWTCFSSPTIKLRYVLWGGEHQAGRAFMLPYSIPPTSRSWMWSAYFDASRCACATATSSRACAGKRNCNIQGVTQYSANPICLERKARRDVEKNSTNAGDALIRKL